ncbi:2-oxoglutarate and iron-dependent oxygenase domain-containing protein [Actinocorallia longicatena]|uniref:2OG-Fe(II) oxygenase family protein n=1 Tax=Actinocorallia longicatena TaxID=111803 RepID=A0ABP6Q425_9ACTN
MPDPRTFSLPETVHGTATDRALGRAMLDAWRRDGYFLLALDARRASTVTNALTASRSFFGLPAASKRMYVNDLTYSGYAASGEEVTAGKVDHCEVFTVCRDFPLDHPRVLDRLPCHGPVPWPGRHYRRAVRTLMGDLGGLGDTVLALLALGLGHAPAALTGHAADGWHHLRALRYPSTARESGNGLGVHTDYGMLVLTVQDEAGGLYVRPPVEGEHRGRNWLPEESTAGVYEDRGPWHPVVPVPGTVTAFPGDILQFLTGGSLVSTPHQAKLTARERYSIAYFHEPSFDAELRPLDGGEPLHYGTHFTNMFLRCYPDRPATRRILREGLVPRPAAPLPA